MPRLSRRAEAPDSSKVRRRLLAWFSRNSRDFFWRDSPSGIPLSRFQVLLVEFLLWKTEATRAQSVILELVRRYPEAQDVVSRTLKQLESELQPLGLQRRRAACLAAFSRQVVEEHGGVVPGTVPELQRLTGIGQYAARATACLLEDSRLMPVDANTARIFGRLFGEESPGVREPGAEWDARMKPFVPRSNPKRFLWATMDLSAAHCRARAPRCEGCPLKPECATGRLAPKSA